jgi:hypothetical protein
LKLTEALFLVSESDHGGLLAMVLTTTSSKTLVVNPAFLQEIKDSNPDLWDLIHRLRQVCQCDEEPSKLSRQLTRLLDSLRDQLALQFSLEESYGYLAVPDHPSHVLSELASRTRSQHGMLYMQLSELAEQAEELQYRGVEASQLRLLIERTRDFDADLREHERAEGELIERSFDLS